MSSSETNYHTCVHQVPIFNHLSEEHLDLIATKVVKKNLAKQDFLYQPGDPSDAIYILNRGAVKIFQSTESGKEQLTRILKPGDFIGETGIFSPDAIYKDYAQAMIQTLVCVIYQSDLQKIMQEYPEVSIRIIQELAQRLNQSEKQIINLSAQNVGTRLAMFLADLVQEENRVTPLPMSKKEIASYIGTTPETLSRKFKVLEEKGLIESLSHNTLKVPNLDDLLFFEE